MLLKMFPLGLRCFACDNVGSGEACITDPGSVTNGIVECQPPNDKFCYTSRLEEEEPYESKNGQEYLQNKQKNLP